MINSISVQYEPRYQQPRFIHKKSNVINFTGYCNIEKCHAQCCYHVPIPRDILQKFADKIVNPILSTKSLGFRKEFGGRNVLPITNPNPYKNKCPFLTLTNSCNIYEDRPALCKQFGSSNRKGLQCTHQE